jgi:hypothetical protein
LTGLPSVLINFLSLAGCLLIRPDGTKTDLMTVTESSIYEGNAQISDNESPGLLYNYNTDGIISFDPGMDHCYKTQVENC